MCAALLLGIDAGTTVIKCTLFDVTGRELALAERTSSLLVPRPGWAEADMNVVWRAVVSAVRAALASASVAPDAIAAIGVTGQGDGTWLVDAQHRPVRPAILWSDGRTANLVEECYRSGLSDEIFTITGTALNTCLQSLHLRWLQEHEPDTVKRTAATLRAKDWIFLNLTDVVATDDTDASGTYFAVQHRIYDPRIFPLLNIETWSEKLPSAIRCSANAAPLTACAAAELGLSPGIPVVAGPYDVAASALGAGAVDHGDACSVLGTAGVHQVVVNQPVLEPANIGYNICHAPPDRWMRLLPAMSCTPNLHWFARTFYPGEWEAAEATPGSIWDKLEERAAQVPLGADGVMYHPYIDPAGERAPFVCPDARAQFSGLSIRHGRDVLLRAVYEGVVLSVVDCYRTMAVPVSDLRLAGGGARSPLWAQMLADALGCTVTVAEGTEYGAKGAVINAGVAIGLYASHQDGVARTVRTLRRFSPTPGCAQQYDLLLKIYRSTRDAMLPVWEERTQLLQKLAESF